MIDTITLPLFPFLMAVFGCFLWFFCAIRDEMKGAGWWITPSGIFMTIVGYLIGEGIMWLYDNVITKLM